MGGGDRRNGTAEQSFQDLLSPIRKGGASQDKAGYNEPQRDQMQRLIEGLTGAEEPAR